MPATTATRFVCLSPLLTALLLMQPLEAASPLSSPEVLQPQVHAAFSPGEIASVAPAITSAAPVASTPAAAAPSAIKKPRARRSVLHSSHLSFLAGAAQPVTPADPTDLYITTEATALGNNANTIFAFVRDQVANQIYSGSLRGARGTLWTMGGNSLDKASLLIALLGAANIQAEYVQGTLSNSNASSTILSMFPSPTIVSGCVPPGTTLASPQTDPNLLSTVANHFWVQFGPSNTAADPSIPGAQIGQTFATASQTFTSIAANLKQMVTITLNVETYSPLGGLGTPTAMLTESYESDLLSGKPISFGTNLGYSVQGGGLFGPPQTIFTYTPYLLLGQGDPNIEQDPIVQGTAFTEDYSNILLSSYVSGIFLQIQAPDTTGTMQTYTHTILDRIGYANRQLSPIPAPTIPTSATPAIVPAQIVTMDILPGLQAQDNTTLTNQQTRIDNEKTNLNTLQPQLSSLPTTGTLTSTQQSLVNSVMTAENDLEIALGELVALSFAATADRILGQAELEYRSNAYYTSPRLILVSTSSTGAFTLDLLKRDIQVIASPGQNASVPVWFEETRGLIEASSEAKVLSSAINQPSEDISNVFTAAAGNLVGLIPNVSGQTMPSLSADSVARIQTALNNGKFVVAPTTTPMINGVPVEGWLEIDQNTGETNSTFADGHHQGAGEYAASLLTSLFGANFNFIGQAAGFGLAGFSFMAGVLNGVAAFASQGKLAKGSVAGGGANSPLAPFVKAQFDQLQKAIENLDPGQINAQGEGKDILEKLADGLDKGVEYASTILIAALPADPEVVPFLSTNIAPAPASITPGITPGVNLTVNLDQYFTAATTSGTEVPTIFVANIQNTGPAVDTFNLTFGSVPGYQIESSVNSVTIPAGQTAEIGVCLVPTGPTAPATTFSAQVTSATNSSVTSSSTTGVNGGSTTANSTIQTSPAGLQVSVDSGAAQVAPVNVTWQIGSKHLISALSPQGSNGTQYTFTNWSDGGALSHTVTASSSVTTYTASFNTSYLLTTSASPSTEGTVSPASGTYYQSGTIVNLTATPNSGYKFTSWTGSVASANSAATTVTMNAPQTVTANFAVGIANVTFNTSPAGLAYSVDGTSYSSSRTLSLSVGQHTIATTSPQGSNGTQYTFANWSDSGAQSHSINVPASGGSYTATFNTSYLLTTSANPSTEGTVSPASGTYYAAGTVVNLAAMPNSGYKFTSWTGNVASANSATTTITMNAPQTIAANFAVNNANVTINTSPAGLQVSVDGGAAQVSPVSVSWQLGSQHIVATTSPQGSNGTQYTFANWSDGGALSHQVTMAANLTTLTANFNTSYLLATSANPVSAGTVSPVSGTYYPAGTVVNLSATPSSGYNFSGWTGSVASANSAATTVTMTAPETVAANFSLAYANITSSVQVTATAFVYDRATKTFNSTYTITNTSGGTITGPLALLLTGLNAAITVANATGAFQGSPFLAISSVSSLGPGSSVSVAVQFSDPTNVSIQATPVVYSGVL